MSTLTYRDVAHVLETLRRGAVPERGLVAIAEGIEKQRAEIQRQLNLAKDGEGAIKFLRGGYGCGKTFMARLAILDAQAMGFATAFVVVSDNDLQFYRFDDVYRRVVGELGTVNCPRGALGDILDRWMAKVEQRMVAAGADDTAEDFDDKVRAELNRDLMAKMDGKAPPDFVRAVQTVFDLKQRGELSEAGALISWLSGSTSVGATAKKAAQIKGDIEGRVALEYLRGVLEIVKSAGYKGMLIVIDEVETILRSRKDLRHKSLNGIRQILDAAGSNPGLLWLFTGTPEFFDARQGVKGLTPLDERIRFMKQGKFASLRQAQLELVPFDAERLRKVAARLRELYPTEHRQRLVAKISDGFIERLVDEMTKGFRGDVGVMPREFLREFVNRMDLVDENEEYEPMAEYRVDMDRLSDQEKEVIGGGGSGSGKVGDVGDGGEDDELVPKEDVW